MNRLLDSSLILLFLQVTLYINSVSTVNEPQVAFFCGRPSNVFRNNTWLLDFQQNCVTDEKKVVEFCKKSFPESNILTAEPAINTVKFKNWCDFSNQNCEIDVEIRPFKCLDKNFQSDALILPRNCQFGHFFNQTECLNYKVWAERAKLQCHKQHNSIVKSYGMLFPCGENDKQIKPMYFKGVEFVCCPEVDQKVRPDSPDESNTDDVYKKYLKNAIFKSEDDEEKAYEDAELNLINFERKKEKDIKKELRDPKQFRTVFKTLQDQFLDYKEKLLHFHDQRLEFIFDTKMSASVRQLDKIFQKPDKTESELYETMKDTIKLIMDRKKSLLREREEATKMHPNTAKEMDMKIKMIDKLCNDFFEKLNMVPEWKWRIKSKLVDFFINVYPNLDKHTTKKLSLYDKFDEERERYRDIILNNKNWPEKFKSKDDDDTEVHYDLGLNDEDQWGHYSKHDKKLHRDTMNYKSPANSKTLLGIIFGGLSVAVFILLVGSGLLIYYQKRRIKGYLNPKQTEDHRKSYYGFGGFSHGKALNFNQATGYENLTYMATSHLGNVTDPEHSEPPNLAGEQVNEKPEIPLIN